MNFDAHTLGIDRLSVGERLELIGWIWDSLPEPASVADIPAWHLAELKCRRAEASAAPGCGAPWRDVLDRLGTKS